MVAAAAVTLRLHPLKLAFSRLSAALNATEWPLGGGEFVGKPSIECVAIR